MATASCARSSARLPRPSMPPPTIRSATARRWRSCTTASTTSAAMPRVPARRRCSPASGSRLRRHGYPVAEFSGGWRMRLNLAQALMCRSDLLLLDEPTNHLDLDAVLWLEDWLARYPGTLLLITHDRDFLDGVVDGIVHFDARKLKFYTGNYSQFERERAQQLALQQATYRSSNGRSPTCRRSSTASAPRRRRRSRRKAGSRRWSGWKGSPPRTPTARSSSRSRRSRRPRSGSCSSSA